MKVVPAGQNELENCLSAIKIRIVRGEPLTYSILKYRPQYLIKQRQKR